METVSANPVTSNKHSMGMVSKETESDGRRFQSGCFGRFMLLGGEMRHQNPQQCDDCCPLVWSTWSLTAHDNPHPLSVMKYHLSFHQREKKITFKVCRWHSAIRWELVPNLWSSPSSLWMPGLMSSVYCVYLLSLVRKHGFTWPGSSLRGSLKSHKGSSFNGRR